MVSIYLVENGIPLSSSRSDRTLVDAQEDRTIGTRNVWIIVRPPADSPLATSELTRFDRYRWAVFITDGSLGKEGFRRVVSIFNRTSASTHIRLGVLYHMVGEPSDPGGRSPLYEVDPFRTEHLVTEFAHCSIGFAGTTRLSDNEFRIHCVPISDPLTARLEDVG
jgi:hypothetical protein